ncbi:hypothetical protein C7H19_16075 [Aphanothece hegewaldii CCALA 016]|uniref:Uncharacterized protein n=1 Tax=Aphanothece hegewaldii CCALA 016 TaxID=2107694 RepID=A0A2T1LV18_9CHRO|nr:hypothetical protein [Aphanothece hegewaldii]PSF35530.1 hypothetical protein C7H19_16075 [Aphanothece hegewaldii CCALA 016]
MLKRIFWAASITIPLYLSIAIESSSKPENISEQISQQPHYVLGYLKQKFSQFQQELEQTPASSVKTKLDQ